ncbi:MAG: phosphoenolpyruvate synthase [archaeon]
MQEEKEDNQNQSPLTKPSALGRAGGHLPKEQNTSQQPDFIKWFSELNKDSGKFAGGKGANLAEIYNLKIPVPPGFVVTAQAYDYFIKKAELNKKIKELLTKINYEDTKQLDETTKQVRELILNSQFPEEMEEEILESYENLDTKNLDLAKGSALDILNTASEPIFVAVRSSATAEDLADASFAGQQDSFVNIKGNQQLLEHIKKCFASLFTSRATYYRNKKGFEHEKVSLAVVVQKMVDSDKSGVIFSKDPSYKNNNLIIEAVFGLGEGIVSGQITPDKYIISEELEITDTKLADKKIAITRNSSGEKQIVKLKEQKSKSQVLKNNEIKKLAELALRLEEHYQKPQDIEFAIEGEEIYIVQTRPITTIQKSVGERKEIKGEVILTGLAASPGIAYGKIKIIENLEDLHKIIKGDILVTKMTNPDMVVSMQKSAAIVTDEGGLTAHAAIVSREMGIPAVVGTQEATTKLKDGEIITVDGFTGKIYKGKVSETVQKEILPVTAQTKTKIKVVVDLPTFAEHASQTKLKSVGLTRIEGIIAESGKHPEYFLKQKNIQDYEEIIFKGIEKISQYFEELWIRTSDIRSDEFSNLEGAPKEKEANPMLGMHGIRFGIKNPEILKAELKALKRVSDKNKKIGLLLPQIISVEEVKKVKEFLQEIEFTQAKIGIMVETPAAVQIIRELCEEGIDFISFGTNDLTQYMLAVDRGNEQVQGLYNEMHPAILYQIEYVIRVCKRNHVETSICGQAGSKKEMVKFLVEKGIDSITTNADAAKEISDYVAELEKELIKYTDKEPRQYQPYEKDNEDEQIQQETIPPTYKENTDDKQPQTTIPDEQNFQDKEINQNYWHEKPTNSIINNNQSEQSETNLEKPQERIQHTNKQLPPQTPEPINQQQEPKQENAIENIKENFEELVQNKGGQAPLIPGIEKLQHEDKIKKIPEDEIIEFTNEEEINQHTQNIPKSITKKPEDSLDNNQPKPTNQHLQQDIEAIEQEKKEYLEKHPEENGQNQTQEETTESQHDSENSQEPDNSIKENNEFYEQNKKLPDKQQQDQIIEKEDDEKPEFTSEEEINAEEPYESTNQEQSKESEKKEHEILDIF